MKSSRRTSKYHEFNPVTNFDKKIQLRVRMKFTNFKVYREALKEYEIQQGINYTFINNKAARITVKCKGGCRWKVHASKNKDDLAFQIKTLDNLEHKKCGWQYQNTRVDAKWLASKFRKHKEPTKLGEYNFQE